MGGIESRFHTLLLEGKTEEAMSMWLSNPENLQEIFRPNVPIKGSPYRDNPLHCSARHGMKILMHEFLEKGADPFSRNDNGETAMHIVCRTARGSSRTSKRQADLLYLLLDKIPEVCLESSYHIVADPGSKEERSRLSETWPALRGSTQQQEYNQEDKLHLGIQDKAQNTPLHLAAASGLLSCVELLLAHGAPLFVQNVAGQTPCDVAWEAKQLIIAKQLESKMVLTGEREQGSRPISRLRNKSFHNTQTLKKLKKDIVENVAKRLSIVEFPAQALLMAYGWSEDLVVEAWEQDKEEACNKAGIDPVQTSSIPSGSPLSSLSLKQCTICFEDIAPAAKITVPCGHHFCQECWKRYLKSQIQEGAGKEIRCPGHGCFRVVPNEVVSDLVPEDLFKKYLELNLHQFVDLYADVKWCPFPDCEQAVSLKQVGGAAVASAGGMGGGAAGLGRPGLNVECGNGHGFCWYCMKEPHEPCECELWEKWKEVIVRMMSVNGKSSKVASEAVANARWIMKCTKPCPNCKSPIQKTEGCNQMTCRKCMHSFCWVCLDPWSVHNHKTGGYFTCNRFKAQRIAEQEVSAARRNMEQEYVRVAEEDQHQKRKKFMHYYERYSNHLNSLEIELKLLQESQAKTKEMEKLGQALEKKVAAVRAMALLEAAEEDGACALKPEENFLEEIFRVLLHARRILSASYCIGYFIPDQERAEIQAHETLQGKLEDALEVLSQQVNRPYLKTPQAKMGEAARNVDYLCEEYLTEMREVAKVATVVEQRPKLKPRQQERRQIPRFETNRRSPPLSRRIPWLQPVDSLRLYRAQIHDL